MPLSGCEIKYYTYIYRCDKMRKQVEAKVRERR